jgi:hypothetical protein
MCINHQGLIHFTVGRTGDRRLTCLLLYDCWRLSQ